MKFAVVLAVAVAVLAGGAAAKKKVAEAPEEVWMPFCDRANTPPYKLEPKHFKCPSTKPTDIVQCALDAMHRNVYCNVRRDLSVKEPLTKAGEQEVLDAVTKLREEVGAAYERQVQARCHMDGSMYFGSLYGIRSADAVTEYFSQHVYGDVDNKWHGIKGAKISLKKALKKLAEAKKDVSAKRIEKLSLFPSECNGAAVTGDDEHVVEHHVHTTVVEEHSHVVEEHPVMVDGKKVEAPEEVWMPYCDASNSPPYKIEPKHIQCTGHQQIDMNICAYDEMHRNVYCNVRGELTIKEPIKADEKKVLDAVTELRKTIGYAFANLIEKRCHVDGGVYFGSMFALTSASAIKEYFKEHVFGTVKASSYKKALKAIAAAKKDVSTKRLEKLSEFPSACDGSEHSHVAFDESMLF